MTDEVVERLIDAVDAFLKAEDRMMEDLIAQGKSLEDFGFPFPLVVEIRSALAALTHPQRGPGGGWRPSREDEERAEDALFELMGSAGVWVGAVPAGDIVQVVISALLQQEQG